MPDHFVKFLEQWTSEYFLSAAEIVLQATNQAIWIQLDVEFQPKHPIKD